MVNFINPGPDGNGKDFNFFTKFTVTAGSYAPGAADVYIPFSTYAVSFQLESGAGVTYSFSGLTDHGDMTTGKASASLLFENRVISKIWFKGAGVVRIEAWSIR